MGEIRKINAFQERYYEDIDRNAADGLLKRFELVLRNLKGKETIKILDIGGGSGYFSLKLYQYFTGKNCEVYVVDTTPYKTWKEFSSKITFIEDSAENVDKVFRENTLDVVFAKYVFYHFVKDSWAKSIKGMNSIMKQIHFVLKNEAYLCIIDQFYNGFPFDASASKMIYMFTSCKLPFLAKVFKKLRAQSVGTGVCFLSKRMWLRFLSNSGFVIETIEEPPPTRRKCYEHLGLLLKTWNDGCLIVARSRLR